MDFVANSKWNVKSLSVSNSANAFQSDSVNQEPEVHKSESCSQGYFSNSDCELERANSSARISSRLLEQINKSKTIAEERCTGSTSIEMKNKAILAAADDIVEEGSLDPHGMNSDRSKCSCNKKCRCTEACIVEERVSFLCFTWKKRKRDVTYHGYDNKKCPK